MVNEEEVPASFQFQIYLGAGSLGQGLVEITRRVANTERGTAMLRAEWDLMFSLSAYGLLYRSVCQGKLLSDDVKDYEYRSIL